jgi:hypothetical protein
MKITIKGEPKEIAALELALKDGKKTVFNVKCTLCTNPQKIAKRLSNRLSESCRCQAHGAYKA